VRQTKKEGHYPTVFHVPEKKKDNRGSGKKKGEGKGNTEKSIKQGRGREDHTSWSKKMPEIPFNERKEKEIRVNPHQIVKKLHP